MTTDGRLDHKPDEDAAGGPAGAPPEDEVAGDEVAGGSAGRRGVRRVAVWVMTVLAALLVLFALIAPTRVDQLTPAAFVRIPVEVFFGVAVILVLPARLRRVVVTLAGLALGAVTIVKIADLGFSEFLDRPFDLVLDWTLLQDGVEFLGSSVGQAGAIGTVVGVVVLLVAVLVLMTLSVLRLTRLAVRHDTVAAGGATALGAVWVTCAVFGAQIVPGVPVASKGAVGLVYRHAAQVRAGLRDQKVFAAQAAVDAFRNTPGKDLLTGLRGKDVVVAFVESYGRSAVEDPQLAPRVDAVLDAGTRRLAAAGFSSRSAFLTSPTYGSGSWLAHSTLMSGLWINNQQRYRTLVASDRLTLNGAFRRASWRSVAVVPGVTRAWPESSFFGFDKIYTSRDFGYHGPRFSWATMPDQYTLSTFQRLERAAPGHAPIMAEMPLLSSHAPWAPLPKEVGWNELGDGTIFNAQAAAGSRPKTVWHDRNRIRAAYRQSVEYSLGSLISYVQTYGDDNLVLVFLGDHQPGRVVTGDNASRDVPITLVARDKAVLDRISGWGWQDGLNPGPAAPVWKMSAFRDQFLTAFGR
ncbi:sulfatase [Actinomadura scrupuli]|uniref:sulfatase n=1 Tax=Actinomadura scrupuli TaxID=559629 RepID=UPI003D96D23A